MNTETDSGHEEIAVPSAYLCYILVSVDDMRTYAGITNNMPRRLRQHNGELAGGAKYTSKPQSRPWRLILTVHGFHNKVQALQFEWALHHTKGHGGVSGRMSKLMTVLRKLRWTRSAPLASTVPLCVNIHAPTPPPNLRVDQLPSFVSTQFIGTQTVETRMQ